MGFTGVYIIFLIAAQNIDSDISHTSGQNIDYGYSLEPPRRGGSNEYPQFMFLSRNKKKISEFLSENFQFFGCKIFSIFE